MSPGSRGALAALFILSACGEGTGRGDAPPAQPGATRRDQPPISINADPPVTYPVQLYEQGIEGTVVLRLFVDSTGAVAPESTTVKETSGHPALDSAAVAAVPALRFAPALRSGVPTSTVFEQPVVFRVPGKEDPIP